MRYYFEQLHSKEVSSEASIEHDQATRLQGPQPEIDQSEASIKINNQDDIQLSQSGLMEYLIKIEILWNTT